MSTQNNSNFTVFGIDISKFQGNEIDSLDKQTDKFTFIICKATEGITYTDPDFTTNWPAIQSKGYVRGAYHLYHCKDCPSDQIDNYMNAVGQFLNTDLPPIVDFEQASIDPGITYSTIQPHLLDFLILLEKRTGKKPMIYTNNDIACTYLTEQAFADYPLWIADYNSTLTVPEIWQPDQWKFWQQTSKYSLDGQDNDYDVFNGDENDFESFIQLSNIK